MPLYDVTYGSPKLITPKKLERTDVFRALEKKLKGVTVERILKTAHEAVESLDPQAGTKVVWTRSAALFGHNSLQPKKNVDHMWEKIISAVGNGKECLLSVGTILMYTIAQREETWFVYRRETGERDKIEDKEITVCEYWVNNNYTIN